MKKGNLMLILFTLISAAALAISSFFVDRAEGGSITVSVDGKSVMTVPLDEDGEYPIESKYGKNVLTVKGGEARMTESDCGGEDCIHVGTISRSGEKIICLPNRVVISVTSNEEGFDAVTGGIADVGQ